MCRILYNHVFPPHKVCLKDCKQKRPSSPIVGKDEERLNSRGTTFIRHCLSTATSLGRGNLYRSPLHSLLTEATGKIYFRLAYTPQRACKPRPYMGGICPSGRVHRFLLAASGSFSRSVTYELSTSRPFSGCNQNRYSSHQRFYTMQLCVC